MKKALSLLMVVVLMMGCSAAFAERYPEGTLYKGMKGHADEIRELQQWLIDLGYLNDKANGKFGKNTQAAVKAFQQDHDLTADGVAWPETIELVEIYTNEPQFEYPEDTLHKGIYGHTEEIEFLQYQLFYAGYLGNDSSVVDGVFGSKTEAAVRQFQKEHNIDVTGTVCPNTQTVLDQLWEEAWSRKTAGKKRIPTAMWSITPTERRALCCAPNTWMYMRRRRVRWLPHRRTMRKPSPR